jgi:hypothetical protein
MTSSDTPQYGLLCMAPQEWYVTDRLRSIALAKGEIQPTRLEQRLGGYCGLALHGRCFRTREQAKEALQKLINPSETTTGE